MWGYRSRSDATANLTLDFSGSTGLGGITWLPEVWAISSEPYLTTQFIRPSQTAGFDIVVQVPCRLVAILARAFARRRKFKHQALGA